MSLFVCIFIFRLLSLKNLKYKNTLVKLKNSKVIGIFIWKHRLKKTFFKKVLEFFFPLLPLLFFEVNFYKKKFIL